MNYSRKNVACKTWQQIDYEMLNDAIQKHGKNWQLIQQKYFPERKANCLKCKYNYHLRRQTTNQAMKIQPQNVEELQIQLTRQSKQLSDQVSRQQILKTEPAFVGQDPNAQQKVKLVQESFNFDAGQVDDTAYDDMLPFFCDFDDM